MEEIQSIHLRDEYVELIRSGRKSIEGRLNRQPYSNILEGQTLRYYKGFTRRMGMEEKESNWARVMPQWLEFAACALVYRLQVQLERNGENTLK